MTYCSVYGGTLKELAWGKRPDSLTFQPNERVILRLEPEP